MTSNAGSHVTENALGFNRDKNQASKDKAMKALKEFLRPEFLGRVDEIIVFSPLSSDSLVKIAALMLDELEPILLEKGIKLTYTDNACKLLAEMAGCGKRGARDLRRVIRKQIEDKITEIIINRPEGSICGIAVDAGGEKIVVTFI